MMSDASPMQDSLQTFQAAPGAPGPARFRPYASTVHHVTKGRYITSNDARGYIPVYEYPLNNQWIMMDIDDGYILWTGIWKALGNSKADIVKMIDSQPDLAHVIRRVRGGYLKIQGTWMPYDVALNLARRVAWNIREDLVPLFGPTFPSTCLSPDQPGYGQVVASAGRRRARRSHIQPLVPAQETHSNASIFQQARHPSFGHGALPPLSDPPRERHRYAPYPISPVSDIQQHMMPPPRRSSASSLLDLPGLRAALPPPSPRMPSPPRLPIHLPAIQTHLSRGASSDSVYALPPISALEDLRGVDTHDAAAVLRRLNSDDDDDDVHRRPARRALSVPAPRIPSPPTAISNAHRRSMGQIPGPALRLRVPSGSAFSISESDTSGSSPSSPASPATPRSAISARDQAQHLSLVPLSVLKEQQSRHAGPNSYCLPAAFGNSSSRLWISDESNCRRVGREASDGSNGCASPSPFASW